MEVNLGFDDIEPLNMNLNDGPSISQEPSSNTALESKLQADSSVHPGMQIPEILLSSQFNLSSPSYFFWYGQIL